jgi:hypothetical protein
MNVTGVDRNGHEWTGVDIFSVKKWLTVFLIYEEGRKSAPRYLGGYCQANNPGPCPDFLTGGNKENESDEERRPENGETETAAE